MQFSRLYHILSDYKPTQEGFTFQYFSLYSTLMNKCNSHRVWGGWVMQDAAPGPSSTASVPQNPAQLLHQHRYQQEAPRLMAPAPDTFQGRHPWEGPGWELEENRACTAAVCVLPASNHRKAKPVSQLLKSATASIAPVQFHWKAAPSTAGEETLQTLWNESPC